ncbi:MAG: hypothetical protein ABSH51_25850 [Solirubrobacteraceae bacterium]|jgi:hypothetical protein
MAGVGLAIALAGTALAAAPLPAAGKVYDNGTVGKSKLTLTLVISPTSARKIESGVPEFSQVAHSGGYLECPSSSKIAEFPFPGATLKLSSGSYGFSVTERRTDPTFLGSPRTGTLTLRITGAVTSATQITGAVTVSGDVCAAETVHYRLALKPTLQ